MVDESLQADRVVMHRHESVRGVHGRITMKQGNDTEHTKISYSRMCV
jgi:hypothetical protein